MSQHTYVNHTPDSAIEALFPGSFQRQVMSISCFVVAEVDDDDAGAIDTMMAERGWEDLGVGDLRPPAYQDTADPAVPAATFTATPPLLGSAATLSDVESLRAACVRLEERQDAILAALNLRNILSGT